jgi:two-component system, LytTR family, response regulator
MNIMIVEDSRLARKELAELLKAFPNHQVVAEAENLEAALPLVNALQPDLLLLDIHLPDGSGFDLLEQAGFTPQVIFTTAYEQHALQAFEVNALDYLLKPITTERLAQALEKLSSAQAKQNINLPIQLQVRSADEHLFIRDGERCHFVKYRDISLLEVDGNYVKLYFNNTRAMLGKSLNYVEAKLDPQVFLRANRQQIINLNYIAHIEPWIGDGLMITLQYGKQVEVSRRQARELKQRLEM